MAEGTEAGANGLTYLTDPTLSWAAKGLWTWINVYGQNAERVTQVYEHALNVPETRAALAELEERGLVFLQDTMPSIVADVLGGDGGAHHA